ncbi:hypothetical protein PRIC1_007988 [Phytophthora ramorum]
MSTQPLQHLSPVPLAPTRSSKAAAPLSFLETVDRVEINRSIVRHDVVYYVLDVFLLHHTSRIPTLQHAHGQRAWVYAQRKHEDGHICKYCSKYMHFILYSLSQPRLYVKLSAGVERRKKLLKSFCAAFVDMALSSKTAPHCDGCQAIPHLVECFLRGPVH